MYGWNPQKPAKIDGNDTTIHNIPTSCAILPTAMPCCCIGGLRQWGGYSAGCGMHLDVHGE